MADISLGVLVIAALADSINPCVFGVLIFLVAYMTKVFKSKHRMLVGSAVYISSVYVTYFLLGLGILKFVQSVDVAIAFYWFAAFVAIIAGLLEIKDFFWYGKGVTLQIMPGGAKRLKMYTSQLAKMEKKHPALSLLVAVFLGFFVVLIELPCTGAPYFAILGLLSQGNFAAAVPMLLLYNLIFILPLFVIVGIMYAGTSVQSMKKWREEHRGLMRLGVGIFLLALGLYMLYTVSPVFQGFINVVLGL
jgi:cytochrome c biogenesis protein CcdA